MTEDTAKVHAHYTYTPLCPYRASLCFPLVNDRLSPLSESCKLTQRCTIPKAWWRRTFAPLSLLRRCLQLESSSSLLADCVRTLSATAEGYAVWSRVLYVWDLHPPRDRSVLSEVATASQRLERERLSGGGGSGRIHHKRKRRGEFPAYLPFH